MRHLGWGWGVRIALFVTTLGRQCGRYRVKTASSPITPTEWQLCHVRITLFLASQIKSRSKKREEVCWRYRVKTCPQAAPLHPPCYCYGSVEYLRYMYIYTCKYVCICMYMYVNMYVCINTNSGYNTQGSINNKRGIAAVLILGPARRLLCRVPRILRGRLVSNGIYTYT